MSAVEIARYFVARTLTDDEPEFLSLLKLQKLVYYAQGFWLAMTGSRLFEEPVLAWEHGPVVRSVWDAYRDFRGAKPIPPEPVTLDEYPGEVQEFLDEVWTVYGQFSAWKLREMTHQEPPWKTTDLNDEIRPAVMQEFFRSVLPAA